jgi:pimeloyl-ACP methyl ester carboxylesterase
MTLASSEQGQGPKLVFVHGFLENKEMWKDIVSYFSREYHCISIDLPGHGESPLLPGIQSMPAMADAVIQKLDALGIEEFAVIGHSMGGYVGLEMARARPDRVLGLCLYHSRVLNDGAEKRTGRVRAVRAVAHGKSFFLKGTIRGLFGAPHRERLTEQIDGICADADKMSQEAIQSSLLGMRNRRDGSEVYQKIPVRSSILGEWDEAVPVKEESGHLEKLSEEFIWLANTGHMSHFEDPVAAIDALKTFVDKVYKN